MSQQEEGTKPTYPRQIRIASLYQGQLKFSNNKIRTSRYNWITFLPLAIMYQFKKLYNFYFLVQLICQLIPQISPFNPIAAAVPFIFVMMVAVIRQGVQDLKRHRYDSRQNNRKVKWIGDRNNGYINACRCKSMRNAYPSTTLFQLQKWKNLRVGDVIKIYQNQNIPSDIILLASSQQSGEAFVQTANLDGERALKRKKAILQNQVMPCLEENVHKDEFRHKQKFPHIVIEYGDPQKKLDDFQGRYYDGANPKPINSNNLILRGSNLSNIDWVIGVVAYTGFDTKLMLNQDKARFKQSRLEKKVNCVTIGLVVIQMLMCTTCAIGNYIFNKQVFQDAFYIQDEFNPQQRGALTFLTFFLLYNTIIPIALIVTFQLIRVVQMICLQADSKMRGKMGQRFKANSGVVPQDLGNTTHIFSDKTGTLTANQMEFKGISIDNRLIVADDEGDINVVDSRADLLDEIHNHQVKQSHQYNGRKHQSDTQSNSSKQANERLIKTIQSIFSESSSMSSKQLIPRHLYDKSDFLRCTMFNIALCHDIISSSDRQKKSNQVHTEQNIGSSRTKASNMDSKIFQKPPPKQDAEKIKQLTYQGGSPDEVELVKTSKDIGLAYHKKVTTSQVELVNTLKNETYRFQILQKIQFTSQRKRMTVAVRQPKSGNIYIFIKGADDVIFSLLDQSQGQFKKITQQHLKKLARAGYRTLVYGYKIMMQQQFKAWHEQYTTICSMQRSKKREQSIKDLLFKLESRLILTGATALEDKLQDNVPQTILDLRDAGIKICMLTGDKLETAINIGHSCKLLSDLMKIYKIRDCTDRQSLRQQLFKIKKYVHVCKEKERQMSFGNVGSSNKVSDVKMLQEKLHELKSVGQDMNQQNDSDDDFSPKNHRRKKSGVDSEKNYSSQKDQVQDLLSADGLYQKMTAELKLVTKVPKIVCNCKSKAKKIYDKKMTEQSRTPEGMQQIGLVIDSDSLATALEHQKKLFLEIFNYCTGIVCCRANPKQKAQVVNLIKNSKYYYSSEGKRVEISALAIGDGGNDVNMIQAADIGIGIMGKEGNQAANSSDYSFEEFRFLGRLILHHGRFISLRFGFFINFFFFKNFLFTIPQLLFAFQNGFSGQTAWETLYMSLYNVITGLPIGSRTVVDQDIDYNNKRKRVFAPYLFRRSRDDEEYFTYTQFALWLVYGIYGALIAYYFALYGVSAGYSDVQDGQDASMWGRMFISYSVLMTMNIAIVMNQSRYFHWLLWLGLIFMALMYFPLVALAYDVQRFTLIERMWNGIMFSPRAVLLFIVSFFAIYFPLLFLQGMGRMFQPRYRDIVEQNGSIVRDIHNRILQRKAQMLKVDFVTSELVRKQTMLQRKSIVVMDDDDDDDKFKE